MATITAGAFLGEEVPQLRTTHIDGTYVYVTESSLSNNNELAPKALLPFDMTSFGQALQNPHLQPLLAREYPILTPELSHLIDIEADVERAMNLYIIHTVNLIFEDFMRVYRPHLEVVCKSQIGKDRSRLDVQWIVAGVAVLLVEVKKLGSLDPSDWQVGEGATHAIRLANVQDRVRAIKGGNRTILEGNAGIIMQQVTKYHRTFETPVILVFDWARTVVLDMNPGHNNTAFDNDTLFPGYFSTDETDSSAGTIWTHRRVFLAALIHSVIKRGL
ncbi:hypothetical protein DFH09DRAFT_281501 [Mycena vulgaris]|nr:hypothetical protein DFH09DRAFT_281501 [Mycena vulgaris]